MKTKTKRGAELAAPDAKVVLRADLVERLHALGYTPGSPLHALLANSWEGQGTYVDQAGRALSALRRRKLTPAQRATVEELARAIGEAQRVRDTRFVAGTPRLSALLVPFASVHRPAATRLRAIWRDGAEAPRELVEVALREVAGAPVSAWGAEDQRELVRELSERLGVRPNPSDSDPREARLREALGPLEGEIGTRDVAEVLGVSRAATWKVLHALERAGRLIGDPRDRNGDWVERNPATGRPVRPTEIFWSLPSDATPKAVAQEIVALAAAPRLKSRRSR